MFSHLERFQNLIPQKVMVFVSKLGPGFKGDELSAHSHPIFPPFSLFFPAICGVGMAQGTASLGKTGRRDGE